MAKGGVTHKEFSVPLLIIEQIKKELKKKNKLASSKLSYVENWPVPGYPGLEVVFIKNESRTIPYLIDTKKTLGPGAQGAVYLGLNLENNGFIAAKVYQANTQHDADSKVERENLALCQRLIGTAQDKAGNEYILMDYYSGSNLLELLYEIDLSQPENTLAYFKAKKPIDIFLKLRLAVLVIDEVIKMHKHNLLHRDIKTANFIIDIHGIKPDVVEKFYHTLKLKLVDLGCGITPQNVATDNKIRGSAGYIDPIYAQQLPATKDLYTFVNDYFSLGVVLGEIFTSTNFQQAIIIKMKEMHEKESFRREFTRNEICAMLPDIFQEATDEFFLRNEEGTEKLIFATVKKCIAPLFADNLSDRPSAEQLAAISQELKKLLFTSSVELKCISPNHSYQEIKRLRSASQSHIEVPPLMETGTIAPSFSIGALSRSVEALDTKAEEVLLFSSFEKINLKETTTQAQRKPAVKKCGKK